MVSTLSCAARVVAVRKETPLPSLTASRLAPSSTRVSAVTLPRVLPSPASVTMPASTPSPVAVTVLVRVRSCAAPAASATVSVPVLPETSCVVRSDCTVTAAPFSRASEPLPVSPPMVELPCRVRVPSLVRLTPDALSVPAVVEPLLTKVEPVLTVMLPVVRVSFTVRLAPLATVVWPSTFTTVFSESSALLPMVRLPALMLRSPVPFAPTASVPSPVKV